MLRLVKLCPKKKKQMINQTLLEEAKRVEEHIRSLVERVKRFEHDRNVDKSTKNQVVHAIREYMATHVAKMARQGFAMVGPLEFPTDPKSTTSSSPMASPPPGPLWAVFDGGNVQTENVIFTTTPHVGRLYTYATGLVCEVFLPEMVTPLLDDMWMAKTVHIGKQIPIDDIFELEKNGLPSLLHRFIEISEEHLRCKGRI